MSGLLSILQNSSQSLQAQTAYASTVSQNLANVNTPGYARQRAELAAALPTDRFGNAFIGRGSVLLGISQARDRFLESQMPSAFGQQRQSATETSLLQGVSVLDGTNSNGLSPSLSNFYSQLRALSQDPGNVSYRQTAVSSAQQLASSFNQAARSFDDARSGIDSNLSSKLPELNQQLNRIASLNQQIRTAASSGAQPNDLLDARQQAVDAVAQMTGAKVIPNSEGDANLTLPDGTALVTGERAAQLSARSDPANDGHLALQVTSPDGTFRGPLSNQPGGELGGMLGARDGAMKTAEANIDQLAYDFANALNAVHQSGYALDGSTGRPLYTVAATASGAAKSLMVNADLRADPSLFAASGSATAGPGDSTNLLAIIGTETLPLSTGLTATASLASLTTAYGASAERAAAVNEGDTSLLNHLNGMRQSVSGVSIDEELINMQKSQRAYEAISKVIKTADDMLNTLMQLR